MRTVTRVSWLRERPAVVVALLPVLVGLLLSVVWTLVADAPRYQVVGALEWVPAMFGLVVTAVLVLWQLASIRARSSGTQQLAATLGEQAARHRRLLNRLDHELKNPIQGIRTALADEPSERQRRSIEVQSGRLAHLLRDLRKVGEVEHTELELGLVDPTALVEEAVGVRQARPEAAQRRVVDSLPRAPRPLPGIHGDDDLLFLAVSNVLGNAVKYSAPGDSIEVRGREDEGWVELEVADTGRGIPEDELDLVGEELGRGREARGTEGSGLGLPLVRAVIARHGGSCELRSWHGQGSTVTIRLPAIRHHEP